MGTEHFFMEQLSEWSNALGDPKKLAVLAAESGRTPASHAFEDLFPNAEKKFGVSPNHHVLIAADALVDAVFLGKKGTDEGAAIRLCEEVFERQARYGLQSWGSKGTECLTSSHGQLWAAAMAAILYVAHKRKVAGLEESASAWWRTVLDIWADHRTPEGVLVPCGRGGNPKNPSLAVNECVDGIDEWVHRGKKRKAAPGNRYMVALRIFYAMPDVPLPKPDRPVPLPRLLQRYQFPSGGFVSFFGRLDAANAQWMVGTTTTRPERARDVSGGWAVFAEKPEERKGGANPALSDGFMGLDGALPEIKSKAYPFLTPGAFAAAEDEDDDSEPEEE